MGKRKNEANVIVITTTAQLYNSLLNHSFHKSLCILNVNIFVIFYKILLRFEAVCHLMLSTVLT